MVVERKAIKNAPAGRATSLDTALGGDGRTSAPVAHNGHAPGALTPRCKARVRALSLEVSAGRGGYLRVSTAGVQASCEPAQAQRGAQSSSLASSLAHERMRQGLVQAAAAGAGALPSVNSAGDELALIQQDSQARPSAAAVSSAAAVDPGKTLSLVVNSRPVRICALHVPATSLGLCFAAGGAMVPRTACV